MNDNKIVNVINFIRGVEPREPAPDLHWPVIEQMKLAHKHQLPTTWLLQYDALIDGWYVDFLKKNMAATHEVGVWFEIMQPLVEKAGLKWRGRYSWDWHTHVGFSVGYSQKEREKIADVFMEEFKQQFGDYPKSMGSWLFDAHLFEYLYERYGIEAACNCKDQWGTDGYTLWGGYWANGYYPSKKNAYLPAVNRANQIPVPIFRMLGSDPIYQYDADPHTPNGQPVVTMEPVYAGYETMAAGGGAPGWVDWFFRENFADPVMAMSYVQIGQENSFGWPAMMEGLIYQYAEVEKLRAAGKLQVLTLRDTGRWFKSHYPETPTSSIVALNDWRNENRSSVWHLSRTGRINFVRDQAKTLALRDWQIFDDDYAEPFLNSVCPTQDCTYDALPILDGMLWAGKGTSRMEFMSGDRHIEGEFSQVVSPDSETLQLTWQTPAGAAISLRAVEATLNIQWQGVKQPWIDFHFDLNAQKHTRIGLKNAHTLQYKHNKRNYELTAQGARFEATSTGYRIIPDGDSCQLTPKLG